MKITQYMEGIQEVWVTGSIAVGCSHVIQRVGILSKYLHTNVV